MITTEFILKLLYMQKFFTIGRQIVFINERNQNIQLVAPLPIKVSRTKNACIKTDKRNSEESKYQSKLQKFVKVHT